MLSMKRPDDVERTHIPCIVFRRTTGSNAIPFSPRPKKSDALGGVKSEKI